MDNVRKIPLTQGKFAIVDEDDFEEVSKYKWYYMKNAGYACANTFIGGKRKTLLMHRLINKTPYRMQTDHISGDKLDNRKSNLRGCNATENSMNKEKYSNNTSGMKGVCLIIKMGGKYKYWFSQITCNGDRAAKTFPFTEQGKLEATIWYNEQALKHFGEFAKLNEV